MSWLLLSLLFVSAAAYKEEMLSSNRIPQGAVDAFKDTCGECKSMIHRFEEALEDPQKLAELKMLLGALCHETSYAEECRLIISKLDIIIKRLEPFLHDAEAVCKKMRLCSNDKLTKFHRLGLLYLKSAMAEVDGKNDFICDECQLAAIEFKKAVDNEDERADIKKYISENICKHIPKYQGACDMMLEEFLPEIWQELDALLANPKQACKQIGFCPKDGARTPFNKKSTKQTLSTFWKKSKEMQFATGSVLMSCFECKVAMDTLLYDLKEVPVYTSIGFWLRDFFCPIMPDAWLFGCNDFMTLYAPTVVYMTVMQMDPAKMCGKVNMCDAQSLAAMRSLSKEEVEGAKCEACKAFTAFMEYEIAQPTFKSDLVAGIENHVCAKARDFSNLCENFMEAYVPKMVDKLVKKFSGKGDFCEKTIHAC